MRQRPLSSTARPAASVTMRRMPPETWMLLPVQARVRFSVGIMSAKVGELSCSKFIRRADAATIAKMKTIRWYVDCGDRDFLLKKNQEFMAAMDRAGIPYKKQIRKGTHSWQYWHSGLFICLPFISESFAPVQ